MKIFLTGGSGFIGSYFLNALAADGHTIVALRRSESSQPVFPLRNQVQWLTKALDEIRVDDLAGCDALVHLASPGVSPKQSSWDDLFYWNVTVSLKLLENARLAGVGRVLVTGTAAEYGANAEGYNFIPATATLAPAGAYAASKAAASLALVAYSREHSLPLAYLRLFTVYGEGQYIKNFWPSLKKAALAGEDFNMSEGEQVRDFMHADKVAEKLWEVLVSDTFFHAGPRVENLGSGVPTSLRSFATEWWSAFHATGKINFGAVPYRKGEMMRQVPLVAAHF